MTSSRARPPLGVLRVAIGIAATVTLAIACSTQTADTSDRPVVGPRVVSDASARMEARRQPLISSGTQSFFWTPAMPATNPGMRDSHVMAYDAAAGNTVLFSGDVCGSSCTLAPNDTWTWNGSAWTKMNPGTSPAARYWAGMVFDGARNVNVLYGGVPSSGVDTSDTWTWNGSNWSQMNPATNPGGRDTFAMAYDSVRQVVVLFGGEKCANKSCTTLTNMNDTWEWNGTNWTQMSTPTAPAARLGMGMAFDAARGVTVLFGGTTCSISCNSVTEYNDTWEWNGTTWTQQHPVTSPTARDSFGMAYDSLRQVTVMFGGFGSSADTWEWNGTTWTQTTPAPSPPYRYWAPMTFDSARGRTVVFGGTIATTDLADTWEYWAHGGSCTQGSQCDTGFCVDGACCNTSSCGTCQSCGTTTNPGVCSAVTNAPDAPSCTGTHTCDGAGACKLIVGQACPNGNNDCANGACVDGFCCNTSCTSACSACAASLGAPANGTCGPAGRGYSGNPPCPAGYACNGSSDTCPTACSSDKDCTTGYYCGASATCQPQKAQGGACHEAAGADCLQASCRECATGNCVDGVCCNTSCSGSCDVCAKAHGASADGTCGTAPAGYTGNPTCSPYTCTGTSENCPSACTATEGCAAGAFCTNGVCQGTETPGEACGSNGACVSGFCVDGVCCSTACTGQCEACDVAGSAGTCTPVAGNPHGSQRPACPTGSATTPCAAALCDGTTRDSCTGFVGSSVTCIQASCTAGVATLPAACDGLGNCPTPVTKNCSPYVCSGTSCKNDCAADTDCADGDRCDNATSTCVGGVTCDGNHTISGANGETTDCSPYTCTPAGCQTTCHDLRDCVSPSVCSGEGLCVLAPDADTVTASCAASPRGLGTRNPARTTSGTAAFAALALSTWLRRRRRHSRGGSSKR